MQWEPITRYFNKEELTFATETLGEFGVDWFWLEKYNKFAVGIPRDRFKAINKKYEKLARGEARRKDKQSCEGK